MKQGCIDLSTQIIFSLKLHNRFLFLKSPTGNIRQNSNSLFWQTCSFATLTSNNNFYIFNLAICTDSRSHLVRIHDGIDDNCISHMQSNHERSRFFEKKNSKKNYFSKIYFFHMRFVHKPFISFQLARNDSNCGSVNDILLKR